MVHCTLLAKIKNFITVSERLHEQEFIKRLEMVNKAFEKRKLERFSDL